VTKAIIAVSLVGLVITGLAYVVVRNEVNALARQRLDQPSKAALLSIDRVASAVDQVLATANGVVVASDANPDRFTTALAPDVLGNPTLSGLALVVDDGGTPDVAAAIGDTPLLARVGRFVLGTGSTTRLVAYERTAEWFRLAYVSRAPRAAGVVYLEVRLPTASIGTPFALVAGRARGDDARGDYAVVLGNVRSTAGLTAARDHVSFGGRDMTLYVAVEPVDRGWFGISLPTLVLLVGAMLTAAAAAVAASVLTRKYAVEALGAENRALDRALHRQREVEAELRASQERFRAILRDTPDVIAFFDAEHGTCEVLNRPDFLGHALDELAAPGGLARLVFADDHDAAERHFEELRDLAADEVCETTLRFGATEGGERYLRMRSSRLDLADARGVTQLAQFSDVTDACLNQAREAELQEALRRSQRREAIGELAGGVAHDFNNLLAIILACAEMLSEDLEGDEQAFATEIKQAATRGGDLVRQLLTFAQRDCSVARAVDLGEIVREMEPLLRRTLGEQIHLQISTGDAPCPVLGDPVHMEQVVLNLAVNARDAMPAGGILWITTATEPAARDDQPPTGPRVLLSVSDSGIGIDSAVRDRMFEPFVTTKEAGRGTGLGLATVHGIVDAAGGAVRVLSEPGLGTTFEIRFPRHDGGREDEPRIDTETDVPDATGRRVLLVEDDASVGPSIARMLTRRDFDVTSVSNAADALRVVEQRVFDVVLTDAIMPGMSGLGLFERLRAGRPELPVVVMSGYSQEIAGRVDVPAGCILRKPFTTPQMMTAIQTAIQTAIAQQQHDLVENA
jgi:signal transduction histidine kinase/ActR/RegA family two-component response regulator